MKKVTLAQLMALPEESRRKVLNAMQVVHQNRQRVKAILANTAPDKESSTETREKKSNS